MPLNLTAHQKKTSDRLILIGNGWQSPRISFTFDFWQKELLAKMTTDDCESPRIPVSLNLSQTDGISPEKSEREDVADVNCDADFEFSVIITNNNDGRYSTIGETPLPVADELFVDGKILPLNHVPVETQPVTISRDFNLEMSTVPPTSSPPSNIPNSCCGNVASSSLRHKHPKKWKEIMFRLSSKEADRADIRNTSSKLVDQDRSGNNVKKQPSCTISMCPFFRISSTGGREMEGNGLFCTLPVSRMSSTAQREYKAATSGCTSKEIETDLSGLVEGSKPPETWSIGNMVQPDPRFLGELKPRFEAEDSKEETKVKQYTAIRGKLDSPGIPASRIRGGMSGQRATGRVSENERLMIRNLVRSRSTAAQLAAGLDSPPPGKPMAEGSLTVRANSSKGGEGTRVSPVVYLPVCIAPFGFFSKREKKQPSTYSSTNRKKET